MSEAYRTFTVSGVTAEIKKLLDPSLSRIIVEGEVSSFKRYPSGHAYFTLKDFEAQISAVMFSSDFERCQASKLIRDGAKMKVFGSVTVYPASGKYQIVVRSVKAVGEGELMARFLELKAKLSLEGLFDEHLKRPLPVLPRRIGIITSEAGAVIHDMCRVLTGRFPNLHILLFPSLVQGADAPGTIIKGLKFFNRKDNPFQADLLIVARGGGSFEDLFCFNDEALVREVRASEIPVISAVGHESDYTLCDFAADKRAGTPSIAGEMAVPVMTDIIKRLQEKRESLASGLRAKSEMAAQRLDLLTEKLPLALTIASKNVEHNLEMLYRKLSDIPASRLKDWYHRFDVLVSSLKAYSPYGVLERGYSLTTAESGEVITDAAALSPNQKIITLFKSGSAQSVVVR
jgi:exodeoxyribonuclease VII large subunit